MFLALGGHLSQSGCQQVQSRRLPTPRPAHHHEPMTHIYHLVDLLHLEHEAVWELQVHSLGTHGHGLHHVFVVGFRQAHPREQVAGDPFEEWQVVRQELRLVDVVDSPQHQDAFLLVGLSLLQVACGGQHTLDCTHAVVVVLLHRQLLRTQLVGGHYFPG